MNLENRKRQPSIDIPGVVEKAKFGDEQAIEALDGFLRPKLMTYFGRRLPSEADFLAQDTLAEVAAAIPSFDPALGRRDYSTNFMGWTFAIARANLNMELRKTLASPTVPFEDRMQPRAMADQDERQRTLDLSPVFRSKLVELLPPAQLETVDLRMSGKREAEIMEQLKITDRATRNRLYRARQTLEDKLLYPAGLKKVSDYEDGALSVAASAGRLEAVQFLGLWYTNDAWVQRYQPRRVNPSQEMAENNYLLLSGQVSEAEYGTLLGSRYRHLLTRHQGRIYITTDALEEFRRRRKRPDKRLRPPSPDYEPTRNFTSSITNAQRLRSAAMRGEIDASKEGTWWFVKPEEAAAFLAAQPTGLKLTSRSLEKTSSTSKREAPIYSIVELEEMPEGEFPEAFNSWFFKTAKIVSDRKLPWSKRKLLPQPDDYKAAVEIFTRQLNEWIDQRGIELYPSFRRAIDLKIKGVKSEAVAEELGWTFGSVTTTISSCRKALEEGLIEPAGIKKVVDYRDNALNAAAIAGRLEAVWFMGRWYTTDQKVFDFKNRRLKSDQA